MSLFDFDQIELTITPKQLLELFSEEQMYTHYYPDFRLGTVSSPFRKDNNPSFRFYETVYDVECKIWWNDQKTGESGHVFTFIQKVLKELHGLSLTLREVYKKVYAELQGEAVAATTPIGTKTRQRSHKAGRASTPTILQAKLYKEIFLPDKAMPYWDALGINRNILEAYHTGFAKEVWVIKYIEKVRETTLWGKSLKDDPIYFYFFPLTKHIKAYRPLCKDKKRKWISNVTNRQDIQGWEQCMMCPNTDLLVLTKSMKDVMWLRSIGIDSMAVHGEKHPYTPEQMEQMRKKYKRIISVYDNDFPGMRGAIKLLREYGIPHYFIPRKYGAKDITDLYKVNRPVLFALITELKDHLDGRVTETLHSNAA